METDSNGVDPGTAEAIDPMVAMKKAVAENPEQFWLSQHNQMVAALDASQQRALAFITDNFNQLIGNLVVVVKQQSGELALFRAMESRMLAGTLTEEVVKEFHSNMHQLRELIQVTREEGPE